MQPPTDDDPTIWFEYLSRILQEKLLHADSWPSDLSQSELEKTLLCRLAKSKRIESSIIGQIISLSFDLGSAKTLYSVVSVLQAPILSAIGKKAASQTLIPYLIVLGELLFAHGAKASSTVDTTVPNFVTCYSLTTDIELKVELLLQGSKMLQYCYRLPERTVKEIARILKTERSYIDEPSFKMPVVEFFISALESPIAPLLAKHLLQDIDYLVKLSIRLLDGTTGSARLKIASLASKLIVTAKNSQAILKRLSRLRENQQESSLLKIIINSSLISQTPENLLPFSIVSSLLLKYRSKHRILGIFEIYRILLNRLGPAEVLQNFEWIYRHFCDIAVNEKFHVAHANEEEYSSEDRERTSHLLSGLCHSLIFEYIGKEMFGESAKNDSIKLIVCRFVDPLSQFLPGASSHHDKERAYAFLSFSLKIIGNLLVDLGTSSTVACQSSFGQLFNVVNQCPSRRVDFSLHLGWVVRCFILNTPHLIPNTTSALISSLSNVLNHFDPGSTDFSSLDKMFTGSYCLASIISALKYRKIYLSPTWFASVHHIANEWLKLSSRIAQAIASKEPASMIYWEKACVIGHCGWVLMSTLMSIGPSITKIHATTIFLFLKTWLSMPSDDIIRKHTAINIDAIEFWTYHLVVKEAAMGALYCFLVNNSELCTRDAAKRVINCLSNISKFVGSLPDGLSCKLEQSDSGSHDIQDIAVYKFPINHLRLLKKRIFKCYEGLFFHCRYSPSTFQEFHIPLLRMALSHIAKDITTGYHQKTSNQLLSVDIQPTSFIRNSTATTFSRYLGAFGLSATNRSADQSRKASDKTTGSRLDLKRIEGLGLLDSLDCSDFFKNSAIFCVPENDPFYTFVFSPENENNILYQPSPVPPAIALVDSAIDIFGILFAVQGPMYQEIIMSQITKSLNAHAEFIAKLDVALGVDSPEQKRALKYLAFQQINCVSALLSTLRWVQSSTGQKLHCFSIDPAGEDVSMIETTTMILHLDTGVVRGFYQICFDSLKSSNGHLRALVGETIGRLARIASGGELCQKSFNPIILGPGTLSYLVGPRHATELLKFLTELIISSSKDPCLRSAACYALSNLVKYVGGISLSSAQLSDLKTIYLRLAEDNNAMVHSWALFSFQLLMEIIGVQFVSAGADLIIRDVVSSVLQIMDSRFHRPFWGDHLPFLVKSVGFDVDELNADEIDPFRNILRILQNLLTSFGPELQFGLGSRTADLVMNLMNVVHHRIFSDYLLISNAKTTLMPTSAVPSLATRYALGPAAVAFGSAQTFSIYSAFSNFTCHSPIFFIQVELLRCFLQYMTFGVGRFFRSDRLFLNLQVIALISPNNLPSALIQRIAIKLIWQSVAIGWSFSKTNPIDAANEYASELAELLFFVLDACKRLDRVENGNGKSGFLEVEMSRFQFSSWATFDKSSSASAQTFENELEDVHRLMILQDLKKHCDPTKWILLCQKVLLREISFTSQEIVESLSPTQRNENSDIGQEPVDSTDQDGSEGYSSDDGEADDASSTPGEGASEKENTDELDASHSIKNESPSPETIASIFAPSGTPLSLNAFASVVIKQIISSYLRPSVYVQCYALVLYDSIITTSLAIFHETGTNEWRRHFDLASARKISKNPGAERFMEPLILYLNDFLKIAFNFGTNSAIEVLRIAGLRLLSSIIRVFGPIPDPDFPEVSILEQYQAQINAGITLAFSTGAISGKSDSICFDILPEAQALACSICGNYITSGIGSNATSLTRVLKLLNALLDMVTVGTGSEVRPALVTLMIRLCVLSTWADIYIETIKNEKIKGLSGIVQTNLQTLASSWLNILKEYSRVRYMSDVNVGVGLSEEGNREILALFAESMYVDFVKASIMPLYESRITSLTEALAICFENSVINLGDFPRELASEMFLDILAQNVQFISEQIRFRGEAAAKVDMDRQLLASLQIISSLFNTNQRFDKIVDFLDADMIMELLRVVEALLWQSVSRNQVSEIETALKIFLRVVEPSFVLTICSQSGFPADFAYLLLRSFIGVCASFTLCSAETFVKCVECFANSVVHCGKLTDNAVAAPLLTFILLSFFDFAGIEETGAKIVMIVKKLVESVTQSIVSATEQGMRIIKPQCGFLHAVISTLILSIDRDINSSARASFAGSVKLKLALLIVCFPFAYRALEFAGYENQLFQLCNKKHELFRRNFFTSDESLGFFFVGARALCSLFQILAAEGLNFSVMLKRLAFLIFGDFMAALARSILVCGTSDFEDCIRTLEAFRAFCLSNQGSAHRLFVSMTVPLMIKIIIKRKPADPMRSLAVSYVIRLASTQPGDVKSVIQSISRLKPAAKSALDAALIQSSAKQTHFENVEDDQSNSFRNFSDQPTDQPTIQLKMSF